MKTISIFLALINSLLAGLILAYSLSPTEIAQTPTWWLFTKMAATSFVILAGVLNWFGSARSINPGVMALCSLFLAALGAAIVAWTFHLALVSGDMEFYMVIYGGSLAVQGMACLFGFSGDSRNVASM
jgi:uncharacterized membrane protein